MTMITIVPYAVYVSSIEIDTVRIQRKYRGNSDNYRGNEEYRDRRLGSQ